MAKISDFLNYGVGDIITLSDLQTQKEFKKMEADFQIIETREYRHPEGIFTYTGYLASYKATPEAEEQQILLLIRQVGDDFDLRVFFMDSDGPSESYEDLFVIDEDDLVDRFDVTLNFDGTSLEVTWDRQGQSNFGIECDSSESEETNIKTLAEYFTNDDTRGNPHCLIEWSGDKLGGYIEIWYGCEIRESDIEMYQTK
jgi:hypothetical protein